MTGREPAWRVFAHEFQASVEEERGVGDRAASYVVSPLGARINRLMAVGTLSPPEQVGKDASAPFLRARLADPTGSITVTAGGFQPRALGALRSVEAPVRALIVGKAHLFRGRDQVAYGSIRAEGLAPISEPDYRWALADALSQTLRRIELSQRVRAGAAPSSAEADRERIPARWLSDAGVSVVRYPTADPASFAAALTAVRRTIASEGPAPAVPEPRPAGRVHVTRRAPTGAALPPSAADRAEEAAFLDLVDELAEGSADGYADLRGAIELAERRGVRPAKTEELLGRLEETGVLEEPVVGKVRRA